jgi:hypothetical protein
MVSTRDKVTDDTEFFVSKRKTKVTTLQLLLFKWQLIRKFE